MSKNLYNNKTGVPNLFKEGPKKSIMVFMGTRTQRFIKTFPNYYFCLITF